MTSVPEFYIDQESKLDLNVNRLSLNNDEQTTEKSVSHDGETTEINLY